MAGRFAAFEEHHTLSLTTYRQTGEPVATPVWFAIDAERVVALSYSDTHKIRRIAANPHVTIAPVDGRGRSLGPEVHGRAVVYPNGSPEAITAFGRLADRYGDRAWRFIEKTFENRDPVAIVISPS